MKSMGDVEILSQSMGKVLTLEGVDARGNCDPVRDLNRERGPLLPEIEKEGICFQTKTAYP